MSQHFSALSKPKGALPARQMLAIAFAALAMSVGPVACGNSDPSQPPLPLQTAASAPTADAGSPQSPGTLAGGSKAWDIISHFKNDNFFSNEQLTDETATRLFLETMCKVEGAIGSYAGFDSQKVDYNDMKRALQQEADNALKAIHDTEYTEQFIRDSLQKVQDGKSYCQLASGG